LLQEGGLLNAFAKKYFNANYIVIYSDLLETYYEGDKDAVEFVIAHEMGHIKRNHLWKDLLLAPSLFIQSPCYSVFLLEYNYVNNCVTIKIVV